MDYTKSDYEYQRRTETRTLDQYQNPDPDPYEMPLGNPSVLAITTTDARYPTNAQAYYALIPQSLTGTETEGSGGVLTALYPHFFALNIGGTVPPSGTQVVCTFCSNRWVFNYNG